MFDDRQPINCILVDFQFLVYASPALDLTYLLHICSSRESRKNYEKKMIRYYYEIFKKTVRDNDPELEIVTYEELLNEFERLRLRAVIANVVYSSSVFLSKKFANDITSDSKKYNEYHYVDRRDRILELVKADITFGRKVEDSVRDFAEIAAKFVI